MKSTNGSMGGGGAVVAKGVYEVKRRRATGHYLITIFLTLINRWYYNCILNTRLRSMVL